MKITLAAALGAATALTLTAAVPAAAQTADFKCPLPGTRLAYKSPAQAYAAFDKVATATGQDGTTCLYASTSDGKASTLRVHGGLIGSVDAQGEAFAGALDLAKLWPLKVGNKITDRVTVPGRDGKTYTATVTVAVTGYEKVTVPAGTFDAFRVEESRDGQAARNIHWWAPALATTVKDSFPDWRDFSKTIVLELASATAAAK